MRRVADSPKLPPCESVAVPLDDATLAYAAAMREAFDQLRQMAGQLAGVMVLAVAAKHGAAGHPMLALAGTALRAAEDAIRSRTPPARGAPHRDHMTRAVERLGAALAAARLHLRADDAATDAVLVPLRAGFRELQWAAGALPGFVVVDFSQGCCARHAAPPATDLILTNQ
jgi:hypothetical protein